ncbi:MAG: beta/gamma crystallin family protein [candidate division Zixibacteria bacterium]|nr:beta/gamma crystallin family protein [candidate division Zixibacteria bacterium]
MAGHIILFKHRDLRGHHRHIFDSELYLNHREDNSLNDEVSSFVILEGTWRFFRHENRGIPYAQELGPGVYRWVKDYGIENDQMSSLECIKP